MKDIRDRVRHHISKMGDAELEELSGALFKKIFPGSIIETSLNGLGKTTRGKCDLYIYIDESKTYIPIICTTQQTNVVSKIIDDVKKILNTRFKDRVSRVILCINSPIRDEVEDYRKECRKNNWELDPYSLDRLTDSCLSEDDILQSYFSITVVKQENNPSHKWRNFDCGPRLQEARRDIDLPISRLIEKIDFNSERQWRLTEIGDFEISEQYILAVEEFSGISSEWLKHEHGQKYVHENIYDYNSDKIDEISSKNPISARMLIEPESMAIRLVVQFSEHNWKIYRFGFTIDFWRWIDDHHRIPSIFSLLRKIDSKLKHPYGHVISREILDVIGTGAEHPAKIIKRCGGISYWFDDVFDINHKYPIASNYRHYGEWFVELQSALKNYGTQEPSPIRY